MEHPKEKCSSETKPAKKFGIRHIQTGLLFLVIAITYGSRASMSVVIVAMTDEKSFNVDFPMFDWDSQQKSLILSSLLWGCLLTQPPIGYLITNGSAKRILCIGMFLNGLATLLIPIAAQKYGWIAVVCCRIVCGMSQGCVTPCSYKLLSSWVPTEERTILGSFVINGAQLGIVIFMTATGMLSSSAIGWPGVFYLFGTISIAWSMLNQFFGADNPSEHPFIRPSEVHYINSSLGKLDKHAETKASTLPWKSILKSSPIWALLTVSCGQSFAYYVFLSELPSYMSYVLKLNIQESGYVSALPYVAMWLLGFAYSWLSKYALSKSVPVSYVRKISNSIGMWAPALCLMVLSFIKTDSNIIYIAIFVLAVGLNAGTTCGLDINLIDLSPNFAGTMVSITNTMAKLCGLLAPIVCGYIVYDKKDENQWHIVFYMTALIYFVTNLIFLLFGKATIQPWNEHNTQTVKSHAIERVNPTVGNIDYLWMARKLDSWMTKYFLGTRRNWYALGAFVYYMTADSSSKHRKTSLRRDHIENSLNKLLQK